MGANDTGQWRACVDCWRVYPQTMADGVTAPWRLQAPWPLGLYRASAGAMALKAGMSAGLESYPGVDLHHEQSARERGQVRHNILAARGWVYLWPGLWKPRG